MNIDDNDYIKQQHLTFCGSSHHTANQRATLLLVVIIIVYVLIVLHYPRVSRLSTPVVVRTQ